MNEINNKALQELIRKNQVVLSEKQKRYLKVKRGLDFSCSLVALVGLSPVLAVVAIAIKLDSPHESVIFKQERMGQYSRPIMVYKFRSMKQGTPELGTSEFMNAEQYITKIGKFIRKTSLDELPQLWGVLCGDRSLVGERPLILREEEVHYLRNYYGIYQLKPGITGLAQINGRDDMGDYDKVRWDRAYVQNVSFTNDVKILWQTVMKVLKSEGVLDEAREKKAALCSEECEKTDLLYNDRVQLVSKPKRVR